MIIKASKLDIVRRHLSEGRIMENPFEEIAIYQELRPFHRNIVPILDCMVSKINVYLVTPFMPKGDMMQRMEEAFPNALTESETRRYVLQIVDGLLFMKSRGIAHM